MSLLVPTGPQAGAGLSVPTSTSSVGLLARPVVTMPAGTPAAAVDRVFRRDPLLDSLAVQFQDGAALLTRARFQQVLIGPLGYGRALHERSGLDGLIDRHALVLSADTPLGSAAQLLLDRPAEQRYDDVLVAGPESLRVLTVSAVLEGLSQHFAHQSVHDPLTGLPNRLLLAERLQQLPAVGVSGISPVLLYVDLDGFKGVNDVFGHEVGDQVLVQCARRLREAVRPDDVVARLGGDEFALLLVEPVTDEQALAVADRLVLAAAAPFVLEDRVVSIGASVGIARADQAERSVGAVEALLRSADAAMYRAKNRGRGCVEPSSWSEPAPEVHRGTARPGQDLPRRLHAALDGGELSLAYQPKFELRTGRLLELEALARWDDDGQPVSPALFIPAAERSGLIGRLGEWALETACAYAVDWSQGQADPSQDAPVVAVNVSPHQLADPGFCARLAQILESTGLPPTRLCVEITETSAIGDLGATRDRLLKLRALGVQIALDDFGTGFSSLTLLRSLPLDWVKIDRSFVEDVAHDPAGAVLVRLVIEAAHSLGVRVCAEGVERAEQLDQLTALGCDAVQGYLLGVPSRTAQLRPSRELEAVLEASPGETLLAGPGQLVVICDGTGLLSYVSAESVHLLGYQPAEMTGRQLTDFLTPASRERLRETAVELVELVGTPLLQSLFHKDGSVVWVEAGLQRVGEPDSAIFLLTGTDVTSRVLTQRQLVDRQNLLSAAFDGAPIGMALMAPDGRHLAVNAALCRLLGRTQEELVSTCWQDVTHPEDRGLDLQHLCAALDGASDDYRIDKRYLLPDGSPVPCRLQVRVVRGAGDTPQYLVAHVQALDGWS